MKSILSISCIFILHAVFTDASPRHLNTFVQTRSGPVQGFVNSATGVVNFLGIPYAQPPIGALRFQPAVYVQPWADVLNATVFGFVSVQTPLPPPKEEILHQGILQNQNEDSLNLNIWTPNADNRKRAVMLYIHGGAALTGAGSFPWHNGQNTVSEGDVVYVTINYRLNAFGWIHLSTVDPINFANTKNLGISDQLTALKWVYNNIESFGGDSKRITLVGHSAGSMSIATLLSIPGARKYIRRAIIESLPWTMQAPLSYARNTALAFLSALNLTIESVLKLTGETAKAVYTLDVPTILNTVSKVATSNTNFIDSLIPYTIVVDGEEIKEAPLQYLIKNPPHGIDILHGINHNEFDFWTQFISGWFTQTEEQAIGYFNQTFSQGRAAYEIFKNALPPGTPPHAIVDRMGTDVLFRAGTWQFVEQLASVGIRAYTYQFCYRSNAFNNTLGASHEIISPFTRDNVVAYEQLGSALPGYGPRPTQDEKETLAKTLVTTWTNFAKYGNPNNRLIPHWPAYDRAGRNVMLFAHNSNGYDVGTNVVQRDPDHVMREAWRTTLHKWLLTGLEKLVNYN